MCARAAAWEYRRLTGKSFLLDQGSAERLHTINAVRRSSGPSAYAGDAAPKTDNNSTKYKQNTTRWLPFELGEHPFVRSSRPDRAFTCWLAGWLVAVTLLLAGFVIANPAGAASD